MVKVQLIACGRRLEELEKAGYGPMMVYEALTKEGLISMSYPGFYSHLYRKSKFTLEAMRRGNGVSAKARPEASMGGDSKLKTSLQRKAEDAERQRSKQKTGPTLTQSKLEDVL